MKKIEKSVRKILPKYVKKAQTQYMPAIPHVKSFIIPFHTTSNCFRVLKALHTTGSWGTALFAGSVGTQTRKGMTAGCQAVRQELPRPCSTRTYYCKFQAEDDRDIINFGAIRKIQNNHGFSTSTPHKN